MTAMTTSINRVNEIYENDLSVRLILVANTNLLIEKNASELPCKFGAQIPAYPIIVDADPGS